MNLERDGFFLPSAHLCVAFVYARNNNVDQKMDGYKEYSKGTCCSQSLLAASSGTVVRAHKYSFQQNLLFLKKYLKMLVSHLLQFNGDLK